MRSGIRTVLSLATVSVVLALLAVTPAAGRNGKKAAPAAGRTEAVNPSTCYDCHEEVKGLKEGGKHRRLACGLCHSGLADHVADSGNRPVTVIEAALCGRCHKDQYASSIAVNREAPARREKGTPEGRSPLMDKLLAPHGFTVEHNEPRGHAFMVTDQFLVDRFAGGRFQYRDGLHGVNRVGKTWDILTDTGKTLPGTGKAGNPTCIQCKTSDHLLKWKYMGDKDPKARWDRASDIIAVAKDTHNPVGCVHCHDPHGAGPRVVRDALIEAVAGDNAAIFADNTGRTELRVVDFRGFRKIGLLGRADSRILCGQCHVEYNCNAGSRWSDGEKVGYDDRRTNHFPFRQPQDLLEHYRKLDFFDFRHEVTGARLIKLQHPETETYWGSVHERSGVKCDQCHMPKVRGKDGRRYTTHGMVRPKNHVREACLGCHPKTAAEEAAYEIDSVQNYTRGKMRKAEYWLNRLIDTYAVARRAGVEDAALAEARARHEEAHVLWEWWTAENSDGWHNPTLARETLSASIAASRKGVEALERAMEAKGRK